MVDETSKGGLPGISGEESQVHSTFAPGVEKTPACQSACLVLYVSRQKKRSRGRGRNLPGRRALLLDKALGWTERDKR